jgi:hypothetical protein
MTLPGLREIDEIARLQSSARRARERVASASQPLSLARRVPPLRQWIPRVSPKLDDPAHLAPLCVELERVARGEAIEVCVSVPPRHGKTTTIVHWIVWLLLQRPDLRVLYCSFGDRMARKQSRAMRKLALAVGVPLGDVRKANEWTTAGGGGVTSCGIEGPPTGDGFDVIIVDDPHRRQKDAESPVMRQMVVDAFHADVSSRTLPLPRSTSIVVVHTRWHVDDLIGNLTRPNGADDDDSRTPYRKINLPALNEADEAIAPKLYPASTLIKIRATKGPHIWASLYQGEPTPKGGALFGAPTWADDAPTVATYAGGVDLARTAKTRSDHQAAVALARDPVTGAITVVDIEHARELLVDRETDGGQHEPGFARRLHGMQRRWRRAPIRMYVGGAETSLVDLLATHRDYPCIIRAVKATASKWDRAQPLAAAWNAGRVRVLRSLRHADELVSQIGRFTGLDGDADDLVDALVAAFDEIDAGPVTASALHSGSALVAARPARRAARDRWT